MKRVSVAKIGIVLSAVPVFLWAYPYGPDPGFSGVPTDVPIGFSAGSTCTACHEGTPLNGGKGSVSVAFPAGMSYTPGVAQQLQVTIADPAQQAWGFQLTARQSSATATMAGNFTPTDTHTLLMCSQPNLSVFTAECLPGADPENIRCTTPSSAPVCPSGDSLQYAEQSLAGYEATKGTTGSTTYSFNWTPPTSNVGNVTIYVAGNAANGDGTDLGDHIYATNYTLTPATANANPPAIDPTLGIQNQTSAPSTPGGAVSPGSFVAIYGTNFATAAAAASSIPLLDTLAGVGVTFNGIAAPMVGIAHGITIGSETVDQINAIVPWEVTGSTASVVVTVNGTPSAAANVSIAATDPGIFYIATDSAGVNRPLAYNNSDNTFAYPLNDFNGNLKCRPVSIANDVLVIWATGLGPVQNQPQDGAPFTNSSGQLAEDTTTGTPVVMVGGVPAKVVFSGLTQYPSIYQINAQLAPGTPTGSAVPLQIQINGGSLTTNQLQIAVTN
jgi:uncharacterized protein (TIGR03437 family)